MKVNVESKLSYLNGKPMIAIRSDGKEKKETKMTLGFVATEALLAMLDVDKGNTGKVKYERYQLAGKIIKAASPVELKIEEIATIKERIGIMYGPEVVGACYDILEKK